MLISCIWLGELLGRPIDVSPVSERDDPLSAANVALRLTSLGLEVEDVDYKDLPSVIVARVDAVSAHPNAKKLSVVELFDGEGSVQVVCGASNLPAPGGNVAFAPAGTTLPNGLTLGERELRGVMSQGMICSEAELDIGGDDEGILVLPADWPPGTLLREQVPTIRDAVIEISVTPNRPDALGHLGVARDLALALGCQLQRPPTASAEAVGEAPNLVELAAPARCPRYLGYALEGCRVDASPLWMRARLHRLGLRAHSNVVDVTNYLLMETGQPMHAFDRAKLAGERVVVRTARAGESLTLLDDSAIELREDDLVIADGDRPQALAGVMGGAASMVTAATDRLLLEIAYFEPRGVRRSARAHSLATDSSHRFERQVDFGEQLEFAAGRARWLLRELCGATCVGRCEAEGTRPEVPAIRFDPGHVGALLGMPVADDQVARILEGLGVNLDRSVETAWLCRPPSFRPDLVRPVDLVEEVMRHHGLDDLPIRHSVSSEARTPIGPDPLRARVDAVTDGLREVGLHEHLGTAFMAESLTEPVAAEFEPAQLVRPVNPMRVQQGCMRPHLLPSLLEAVALNQARHARPVALFEVGRIYRWRWPLEARSGEGASATAEVDRFLPDEPYRGAVIRAGRERSLDGSLAKAVTADLSACLRRMGLRPEVRPLGEGECPWLHPGIRAGLWVDGVQVGVVGELHPDLSDDRELGYGELWLEVLPSAPVVQVEPLARFPATARDLSLDLARSVSSFEVVAALSAAADGVDVAGDDPPRLDNADEPGRAVVLLEDYQGEGVEDGRHALLLRLNYRARERTVTDDEVSALHNEVVERALAALRERDPAARAR